MSTGADCRFYVKNEKWYYDLQQWPYGANPDYDTFGPFDHHGEAIEHLDENHANPGGWCVIGNEEMMRDCKHERVEYNDCYHCGKYLKQR